MLGVDVALSEGIDFTDVAEQVSSLKGCEQRMEVSQDQGVARSSPNAYANACTDGTNSLKSKDAEEMKDAPTHCEQQTAGVSSDLQRVIDAWPALPEAVRHGLLTIIDAVSGDLGEVGR